jgi:hypothetical protein
MVGTARCAFAHPTASPMPRYSAGFSSRLIARSPCKARLARRSARRSIIWLMIPRGFFGVVAAGARRTGGEIFSNVNAGIVCPLAVEMNHLLEFPCYPDEAQLLHPVLHPIRMEHFQAQSVPDAPRMRRDCGPIAMILK